ncbi:MAG: hypothetical protein AAB468_03235 [Patescibacteria group bacterium]
MKTWQERLTNWRQKPRVARERLARVLAGALTGLIALVWLAGYQFPASLESGGGTQTAAIVAPVVLSDEPQGWQRVRAGWREVRKWWATDDYGRQGQ